ncbi:hypothetical protein BJ875DRAFT_163578 [Amylocarpus encephaloides]|uniref:Uncharacterized protein n=1 Tax=Amylocarpus encephaloides TaxID=45428 RepID=A0A9P7YBJ5_9HELO|nr:hypothetical protein BJ875DRAFT_163578 [Amylocarpus encephaloides]
MFVHLLTLGLKLILTDTSPFIGCLSSSNDLGIRQANSRLIKHTRSLVRGLPPSPTAYYFSSFYTLGCICHSLNEYQHSSTKPSSLESLTPIH